jgi:hypothetical protein
MNGKTMEERVTDLEKLAQTLAPLPGAVAELNVRMGGVEGRLTTVESQIVQLRTEMNDGFSAVRAEMADMKAELTEDIAAQGRETAAGFLSLGTEMRTLHEDLIDRIARLHRG